MPKKKNKNSPAPKQDSKSSDNKSQYGWGMKFIVFTIAGGLLGSGFIAVGSMTPQAPQTTPVPEESIISEQEITIPATTEPSSELELEVETPAEEATGSTD